MRFDEWLRQYSAVGQPQNHYDFSDGRTQNEMLKKMMGVQPITGDFLGEAKLNLKTGRFELPKQLEEKNVSR